MSIYLTIILGLIVFFVTNKIIQLTVFKFTDFLQTIFRFTWILDMIIVLVNIICSFMLSYEIIDILNEYFKIIGY